MNVSYESVQEKNAENHFIIYQLCFSTHDKGCFSRALKAACMTLVERFPTLLAGLRIFPAHKTIALPPALNAVEYFPLGLAGCFPAL